MFGTEFGELGDFAGEGFGGGMADIELNRKSKSSAFADHHKTSDGIDLAVSGWVCVCKCTFTCMEPLNNGHIRTS